MYTIYICNAHGAGTGEACCQHAEETGWYDEPTLDEELESKTEKSETV